MADLETKKRQAPQGSKSLADSSTKFIGEKAKNKAQDHQSSPIESVRQIVGVHFVNFLKRLKWKSLKEIHSQQVQIDEDYNLWAETYNLVHKEFLELWDFFNLIEHDAEGWFRVAPKDGKSFIEINNEGYSFAAGVEEENSIKGAPMPKKWLIVSLAHSDHWVSGFGDERKLGRPEPINDILVGLNKIKIKDIKQAQSAAAELKRKALETPLVFQMYSEKVGQRGVKVPLNVLQQRSLVDLCKGLFLALNKDVLDDFVPHLPKGAKVERLE